MIKKEFDDLVFEKGFRKAVEQLEKECDEICNLNKLQSYVIELIQKENKSEDDKKFFGVLRGVLFGEEGYNQYWVFNVNQNVGQVPKPIKEYKDIEEFLE